MDERIRYFKAVVDARSITKASRRLHIAQPSLSTAITKLEKELGTTLLYRSVNYFEITDSGRLVYEFADDQDARKRLLLERLAKQSGQLRHLRLGMIDSIADTFCTSPGLLQSLEAHYQLSLTVDTSTSLLELMRRQELDYAIIVQRNDTKLPIKLRSRTIGDEALLDIASARSPQVERLIAYNHGSTTFRVIQEAFATVNRPFEPAMYSTSPETMLRLVKLGWGHAILPFSMIKDDLKRGQLLPWLIGRDGYARRPINITYRYGHESLDLVADTLRRQLAADRHAADELLAPQYEDLGYQG